MQKFTDGRSAALELRPDDPVYCFRPHVLRDDAVRFKSLFPGRTAYAVKTNGEPMVIETLARAGIDTFDVASPSEFDVVRRHAPGAQMLYMHPVKTQTDIRRALSEHQIMTHVIDHEDEIAKLLRIVRALDFDVTRITVFVRIQTKGHATYELSRKFGAGPSHAAELLQRLHRIGFRAGLCFHVGSQIEEGGTYADAIRLCARVRAQAGVPLTALDVGGGFPAAYGRDPAQPANAIPQLPAIIDEIKEAVDLEGFDDVELVAEPGRVIVARAYSLIVRVLLRKGRRLYINDGIWASLSDSWTGKLTLPARFIPDPNRSRRTGKTDTVVPFRVCGATCDSVDILSRPFWLPETVDTGDWVEIGHIGAYSMALRTRFNGFYPDTFVEVEKAFDDGEAPSGFATLETMGDTSVGA